MSVLRQDPTTGGWVLVAPGRRERPHEAIAGDAAFAAAPAPGNCPLCPGHESETPGELLRLPASSAKDWTVRVVPNKFPVLEPSESAPAERYEHALLRELRGVGHHELIVDSPTHGLRMAAMTAPELTYVLDAYHARYEALRRDPNVAYIIVFKNSGPRAGASLVHPHSQLVATPMAPLGLERRFARARAHHRETSRCLYCDLVDIELEAGRRVVVETERFAVLCPFASGVAFETWILPKRHQPSFGMTEQEERAELAALLRSTLRALDQVLDRPDFNYVLHTAPIAEESDPYYLWHLQILPRISTLAGFELGSGIPINTTFPEEAAAALRRAVVVVEPEL